MDVFQLRHRTVRLSRAQSGFTLLEMLVAAGVTAVLAGIMLTVVVNAMSGWSRSQGALTTEGQARLVLDQLAMDLEAALSRNDGNTWLAISAQDSGFIASWVQPPNPKPSSLDPLATRSTLTEHGRIADARFGAGGCWLRLITAAPVVSSRPTPAAVSYQIVRRTLAVSSDASEGGRYRLFRSEVSPATTFADGYDLSSPSLAYAATLRTPVVADAIADNVIDFGLWLYARDENGSLVRVFPTNASASELRFPTETGGYPEVADVVIRVLTPEGVRRISALEENNITGDWWEIAEQHSKVYARRIRLRPRGF